MSKPPTKADDFLRAMQTSEPVAADGERAPPRDAEAMAPVREVPRKPAKPPARAGLKHFGGYLDDETLEKIAVLRVRLKKDNSELIKLAIDDLHRKHNAKRAFGDA
jgi:hypothetical protein